MSRETYSKNLSRQHHGHGRYVGMDLARVKLSTSNFHNSRQTLSCFLKWYINEDATICSIRIINSFEVFEDF